MAPIFSIQEGSRDVMVWCRTYDGRRVCVAVVADRLAARLWIGAAMARQQ